MEDDASGELSKLYSERQLTYRREIKFETVLINNQLSASLESHDNFEHDALPLNSGGGDIRVLSQHNQKWNVRFC